MRLNVWIKRVANDIHCVACVRREPDGDQLNERHFGEHHGGSKQDERVVSLSIIF